jgi:hypothetical protein
MRAACEQAACRGARHDLRVHRRHPVREPGARCADSAHSGKAGALRVPGRRPFYRLAMRSLVIVAALASPAHADFDGGPFVSGGLAVGLGVHDHFSNGLVLGGELSAGVGWFPQHDDEERGQDFQMRWLGGYLDLLADRGSDTTRLTIGPELGIAPVGIDGGLLIDFGDTRRYGFAIRPVVSLAFAAVYLRYERYLTDGPESHVVELGLLLKIPKML